ncbi:MAG TPA: DsrE family protein, partial [Anaeromyxobacteraceae bacterium]|nr:DsrE family protein [Anaeromyxobacteraceae bacterium]
LMGDAVACAKAGQATPDGYYNLGRMLKPVLRRGRVLLCGSCLDARGLAEAEMVEGAKRSTLEELAQLSMAADKVIVF